MYSARAIDHRLYARHAYEALQDLGLLLAIANSHRIGHGSSHPYARDSTLRPGKCWKFAPLLRLLCTGSICSAKLSIIQVLV